MSVSWVFSISILLRTISSNVKLKWVSTRKKQIKKKWIIGGYERGKKYSNENLIFKIICFSVISSWWWDRSNADAVSFYSKAIRVPLKMYVCCFVLSKHYFRSLSINAGVMHHASNFQILEIKSLKSPCETRVWIKNAINFKLQIVEMKMKFFQTFNQNRLSRLSTDAIKLQ